MRFDKVADAVGLQEEYEYAARKVLEVPLRRHTDSHAGRGKGARNELVGMPRMLITVMSEEDEVEHYLTIDRMKVDGRDRSLRLTIIEVRRRWMRVMINRPA